MRYWLMKTEPEVCSIQDLKKSKTQCWDGVRNYQARNFMMKEMQLGDQVLFYHSNAEPSGVAGIAEVSKLAYPDHTQFDKKSDYYDAKATKENPRWYMVDVKFVMAFKSLIPLELLRQTKGLEDMLLLKRGNRLSITPVSEKEFEIIKNLGIKA